MNSQEKIMVIGRKYSMTPSSIGISEILIIVDEWDFLDGTVLRREADVMKLKYQDHEIIFLESRATTHNNWSDLQWTSLCAGNRGACHPLCGSPHKWLKWRRPIIIFEIWTESFSKMATGSQRWKGDVTIEAEATAVWDVSMWAVYLCDPTSSYGGAVHMGQLRDTPYLNSVSHWITGENTLLVEIRRASH